MYEPLINKRVRAYFHERSVKSAFNFYTTYRNNATKFKEEEPEHWKVWLEYLKEDRMASFSDWLLDYSFQDVVE